MCSAKETLDWSSHCPVLLYMCLNSGLKQPMLTSNRHNNRWTRVRSPMDDIALSNEDRQRTMSPVELNGWSIVDAPIIWPEKGRCLWSSLIHSRPLRTSLLVTIARASTKKKDTSVTFWAERIFFLSYIWHFYDDNCDKTRYHHRCGGLLLLWQKIMTENGLFVLGGPETQLHDILWAVHDGKTMVEARARKISGSSRYGGWSGAERCTIMLHGV